MLCDIDKKNVFAAVQTTCIKFTAPAVALYVPCIVVIVFEVVSKVKEEVPPESVTIKSFT